MTKTLTFICTIVLILGCSNHNDVEINQKYAALARQESLEPIHPGVPGVRPFWNKYSKRFIHAPSFHFEEMEGVKRYRFTLTSMEDSQKTVFEAPMPWAPLSPIWGELKDGHYQLIIEAMEKRSDRVIQKVGERVFLKSTPFAGVTTQPAYPYRESGYRNLNTLLHQPKIQHWLTHGRPDPSYPLWCHPTKIMSALVIGMIHYAEFFPDADDADQAVKIANIVVEFLMSMAEPGGTPLEYWPPTYWDGVPRGEHPYFHNQMMTNSPAIGAEMLLDLYDFTGVDRWFDAAKRIADTYVKTQRAHGTWPQLLSTETGEAVKRHLLVPTMVIELYDRFQEQYGVSDYLASRAKAFDWCMDNPVETFNWQAQFEDTRPQSLYKNLSREEPSEFARILLKESEAHPEYIGLAKELLRFAEDQFVVWEPGDPVLSYPWFRLDSKWNGTVLEGGSDWFIPCALEQYKFYTPIARSSQLMILAYLEMYEVTDESIYHARAVALANALTVAQAYHGGGEIPTHLRRNLPEANWLNNGVYPSITLIENAEILSKELE